MNRILRLSLILTVFSGGHVLASTITFFGGTDFRIQEVTGVNIGGTDYTATFTHGVSYNTWITANPGEPSFSTIPGADAAEVALRAAINILTAGVDDSGSSAFTEQFFVPYAVVARNPMRECGCQLVATICVTQGTVLDPPLCHVWATVSPHFCG